MKIYLNEKDSDLGGLRQVSNSTPDGYRYVPLDVPKFQYKQKVLDTFKKNSTWDIQGNALFSIEETQKYDPWKYEVLVEREHGNAFSIDTPMPFTNLAKQKYPELIEYLMMRLPFHHFLYVKLIMPHRDVFAHIDNNYLHYQVPENYGRKWFLQTKHFADYTLENEPCGYHIHINGSRDNLYIAERFESRERSRDNRDWSHIEADYCELPESTDTYAMMVTNSPHGVTLNNDVDRLSVFIIGKVIKEKHLELINKSITKYSQYCKE